MTHSDYKKIKFDIKFYAENNKYLKDKPLQRMLLNDYLDSVLKSNVFINFNEKRKNLYILWLQNYICSLHP